MEEEIKKKDKETILYIYNNLLPSLATTVHESLAEIIPLFHDFKLEKILDTWTKGPDTTDDTPISIENGNIQNIGLRIYLEGFQRAGATPFDIRKDLIFKLNDTSYEVCPDKNNVWLEKLYSETWSAGETQEIAKRWTEDLIAEIMEQVEKLL